MLVRTDDPYLRRACLTACPCNQAIATSRSRNAGGSVSVLTSSPPQFRRHLNSPARDNHCPATAAPILESIDTPSAPWPKPSPATVQGPFLALRCRIGSGVGHRGAERDLAGVGAE